MSLTTINSGGVKDDSIVNADIKSDAAIAGSKISPDFGSQNIVTTGSINIGAGTGRLDSSGIIKTSNGTEAAPSHTFINDPDNGMLRSASNQIAFSTGGSTALTIDSSQNVGIGTTSPTELLEVYSTGTSTAIEISAGEASTTTGESKLVLRSLHSSSGTAYSRSEIASLGTAGGDSDLILRTTTDNSGPQERLRIDSSGNVLLDSTSSVTAITSGAVKKYDAGLEYWNSTAGSSSAIKFACFQETADNTYGMGISASLLELQSQSAMAFFAGSSGAGTGRRVERMRIDSSGNVGINESTSNMTNGKLTVKLDTNKHIAFNPAQGELGSVPALVAFQDNGSLQDIGFRGVSVRFAAGSAERGRFTDNGLTFNGDTAAANALDDYEEGTWTIGMDYHTGSSWSSVTFDTAITNTTGHYVKIGKLVTVQIYTNVFNVTAPAVGSFARITGLPFTNMASNGYSVMSFTHGSSFTGGATTGYTELSNTTVRPTVPNSTTSDTWKDGAVYMMMSGTYEVA